MRVLRQFANLLSKTITAWETFNQREIRYFYRSDRDELAEPYWGTYLVAIERDVTEMRTLHETVKQQTELFENMTNSVGDSSFGLLLGLSKSLPPLVLLRSRLD